MELSDLVLESLDVYRDGGSVSASFREVGGNLATLLFKVNIVAPEYEAHGYVEAFLEEYVAFERTSPITGITHRDFRVEKRTVSWEEASRILKQLEGQVSSLDSPYLWVFPEMVRAAAVQGREA